MTIPPIAVESAKEAAHRLLELCMSDAPPLDKDLVRTHALDVIEALTEEDPDDLPPSAVGPAVDMLLERIHPNPLQVLHDRAGCCTSCRGTGADPSAPETGGKCWDCRGTGHPHDAAPVLLVCRECREGKHEACDSTAWDELADAAGPCSCTHPGWVPPGWPPEAIDRLKAALEGGE